jgi:hypothetical protein
MSRIPHLLLITCISFFVNATTLDAAIETGTDTTDTNGYGLDSLFQIKFNAIWGNNIAHYQFDPSWCRGYFNYSFDEITDAPKTIFSSQPTRSNPFYCFVVKDTVKGIYSKVEILKKVDGNRYSFRYLTNNTIGSTILTSPGVSSYQTCFNNVFFTGIQYQFNPGIDSVHTRSLYWDSLNYLPGSINNYKYFLMISNAGVIIDTNKPIIKTQWHYVPLSKSPQTISEFPRSGYVNVAVISGKDTIPSLSNWTRCSYDIMGVQRNTNTNSRISNFAIKYLDNNIQILFPADFTNSKTRTLDIVTIDGRIIKSFRFTGNKYILNRTLFSMLPGCFLFRFTSPDEPAITARFIYSW